MTHYIKPNLDHRTTLPRSLYQRLCVTSFSPRTEDIVLEDILPLQELSIGISMSNRKLHLLNFGQTTLVMVEFVSTSAGAKPTFTEFGPRAGLFIQTYMDFSSRYFVFPVMTPNASYPKLAKLGINISTNDKTLWLEYKLI